MLVVGEEEMKADKVALRVRDGSQQKDQDLGAIVARVQDRIRRRAPEL
jgi:threonyl-tRNA synthetase